MIIRPALSKAPYPGERWQKAGELRHGESHGAMQDGPEHACPPGDKVSNQRASQGFLQKPAVALVPHRPDRSAQRQLLPTLPASEVYPIFINSFP